MIEHSHPTLERLCSTKSAASSHLQVAAWPAIASGQHAKVRGKLPQGSQIAHVSPASALSNAIQRRAQTR
jgi:hypothetical protein